MLRYKKSLVVEYSIPISKIRSLGFGLTHCSYCKISLRINIGKGLKLTVKKNSALCKTDYTK